MASPITFRSTDSDAPTLSGTAGDLLTLLNGLLTIKRQFTAISGASFVDNTTEARSNIAGQTPFALFQGPTVTSDEAYFGLPSKFDRITFAFGTAGVQNAAVTLAWEYWNGTAWVALSGVADGTTKLTANGKVTWTLPTDWATKSVNSVTCFWVRVRFTAGSWTTNPLVNYSIITGWVKPFADASSVGAFQMLGGNGIYLSINDNAPGTARDARPLGYATMSALQTGTDPFPAVEAATMAWRKSATADATTRAWLLIADDRTVRYFVKANDTNTPYRYHEFGEFYSLIPGDAYRALLMGNNAETAGSLAANNAIGHAFSSTATATLAAHFLQRAYTGFSVAAVFGKMSSAPVALPGSFGTSGGIAFPNGADGGVVLSPVWIMEAAGVVRGRLRGVYYQCHPMASFADGDTFAGSNAYAGRTFLAVRWGNDTDGIDKVVIVETSDTWDTN